MARLEIDIALNNLQGATNGLKELQKNLNNLSGKGVKIDIGGSAINDVKAQSIEATTAIKQMVASANVNNATFLTKLKGDGIEAKTALTALNVELKKAESLSKIEISSSLAKEKEATEQARRAYIEYNLERKKLIDESKSMKALDLKVTGEGSIVAMRNRLNELRKIYDNLSVSQRNSAKVQGNLVNEINRLNQSVSKAEQATGRYQRQVGDYAKGQSNANGVAMEFNRIIQDAPFGMMGVGNNIQQLAANWQVYTQQTRAAAAETGKTVTTMTLVKGALSSIISPANLLTLGIAAITSAWTAYTMWSQKAKKSTEEAKDSTDSYRNSLSGLNKELVNSNAEGQKELSRLRLLKSTYEDVSQSQNTRKAAYKEILSIYEDYYGKLSNEEKKAFDLANAYNKLANTILKTATARGYERQMDKNIDSIIDLNHQIEVSGQKMKQAAKEWNDYRKQTLNSKFGGTGFVGDVARTRDLEVENRYKESVKENNDLINQRTSLLSSNEKYQRDVLRLGVEGAKITKETNDYEKESVKNNKDKSDSIKQQVDYLQQIKDLQGDKEKDLDLINVEGYARDLKELEWKYKEYFSNLTKIEKKYKDDEAKNKQSGVNESIEEARKMGVDLQKKEKLEIEKTWLEKRNELTKSANDKWGFISETSREKDFANLKNYIDNYRKELLKANATAEEVAEKIASIKSTATFKINVEYYKPMLDDLDKENDSIAESINKPFTSSNTMKMRKELDERLRILRNRLTAQQAAYDKISTKKGGTAGVEKILKDAKKKWEIEINAEFSKQTFSNLVSSFDGVFSTLFSNLSTNADLFGSKVGGIFKSLAHSLLETIGGIMDSLNQKNNENVMNKLLDGGLGSFKKNWSEMMGSFEGKVGAMAAASDLLGNAIGSLTKKTSELGQGVAGGLKGAASGAQIGTMILPGLGTAIGAGIGGIIGGIKGIFGAKKAKKQEELQRQQLLEQQKANALLERMNALAYTSSIIGGQSQYGIVGGVNRSFDGQFEFVIDGQKMRSVLTNVDRFNGR